MPDERPLDNGQPEQTYCSLCTAIGNTEGMVPATCRTCIPPRHPVCATCWPYPGDPCVCQMAAHA